MATGKYSNNKEGNLTMPKKLTTQKFMEKAKEIHNNIYDYSKVNYKNSQAKIKIVCPEHGEFLQTPICNLSGKGCPACVDQKCYKE